MIEKKETFRWNYKNRNVKFKVGDFLLSGRHKEGSDFNPELEIKRYTVQTTTSVSSRGDYSWGDIIPNSKEQYYDTIHAIQGSTIKKGNIFILVNTIWDIRMIYVAVSRAVNIEQIILLSD